MSHRDDLTGLLSRMRENFDGDHFTVQEMIEAIEDRGFGPLLLAPALFVMPPIGVIPGVPTLMALVIVLLAGQLALGRRHPWLPRRLRSITIERKKFDLAYDKVVPVTRRIDRLLYPSLPWLTRPPAPRLIAVACLLLALCMVPLELVPFAAAVPAAAIALLALALSVRDGRLILLAASIVGGGLVAGYVLNGG
ncbi:exopolysaccharide biosynthesis protein [Spectribacter hydrogenoxidans]|uniref:Exopolysaccharide biosynthesis protein n=1 Tax=Spectribacter hydrogenoxidans TaxID=3075608 RepID=A0ABU3C2M6_9GAMM|nr:exopolysaccharide biosynthesis protein [Salinisphaera sp. W335]MDT0635806.1 exopolysaccharide biosynthesis protein [Salinisphaera sp. W335]